MLDATPPESEPESSRPVARATANTRAPRNAFLLSLLSVIGVAAAADMAHVVMPRWGVFNPNLGFNYVLFFTVGIIGVLGVSLVLAIMSLGIALPWRRAGDRRWLSILSTTLAAFAILGVAVGFALIVVVVILFMLVMSEI